MKTTGEIMVLCHFMTLYERAHGNRLRNMMRITYEELCVCS